MKPTDQQIIECGQKYFKLQSYKTDHVMKINDKRVFFVKHPKTIEARFIRNDVLTTLIFEHGK